MYWLKDTGHRQTNCRNNTTDFRSVFSIIQRSRSPVCLYNTVSLFWNGNRIHDQVATQKNKSQTARLQRGRLFFKRNITLMQMLYSAPQICYQHQKRQQIHYQHFVRRFKPMCVSKVIQFRNMVSVLWIRAHRLKVYIFSQLKRYMGQELYSDGLPSWLNPPPEGKGRVSFLPIPVHRGISPVNRQTNTTENITFPRDTYDPDFYYALWWTVFLTQPESTGFWKSRLNMENHFTLLLSNHTVSFPNERIHH